MQRSLNGGLSDMQRSLLMKSIAVAVLALLLLVPLQMIEQQISERASYRDQAQREISESYADAQTVTGPVLVIPYVETTRTQRRDDGRPEFTVRTERTERLLVVMPVELSVSGDVQVQTRSRGIHQTQVWRARDLTFSGRFVVPVLPVDEVLSADVRLSVTIGEPYIAFGISDLRGFVATPSIELAGETLSFEARPAPPLDTAGVRAPVAQRLLKADAALPFRLAVDLAGTGQLAIVPLGELTRISLQSNWPHPSFGGRFLPIERSVSASGFSAQWSVPAIATNARLVLNAGASGRAVGSASTVSTTGTTRAGTAAGETDTVSVRLIQPADVYAQAARATKYGALFVLLTFGAFWIFEALRQVPIHSVQYGFVGAALAIFFLLLLALSEHLPFSWSYLVAALACIALIGVYLASVLRGVRMAAIFSTGLGALYASLYAVLRLEDTALLIGALLLFGALACAMLLSRRIDWNRLAVPGATAAPDPQQW